MKKSQSKKKKPIVKKVLAKKKPAVKKAATKKALPKKASSAARTKARKRSASKRKQTHLELVNFKVTKQTHSAIIAQAKKFAKGNTSAWLRYAAMNHKPAKNATIR